MSSSQSHAASQATRDAYAYNARVRAIVVENLRTIRYQCIGLDSDSQSTGSDSMPGNVRMAIDEMITTLEAMKACIDGAHESQ